MKRISALLMLAAALSVSHVAAAHADTPTTYVREITRSSENPSASGHPSTPASPSTRSIKDVVLQEGGVLKGRFVDDAGTPIDGARLVVRQNDRVAAVVITDRGGEFSTNGLSRGVYRIESPTASADYRIWESDDAPPSARTVALVVSQNPTLRGQFGYRTIDLVTLGLGAGGVTLGILALDKADDAQAQSEAAILAGQLNNEPVPVSP